MAKPSKQENLEETNKIPVPTPKPTDFEKRAKMYQVEVELLQRKFSVIQRPVITTFGPDIQLTDAKEIPSALTAATLPVK